MNTEEKGSYICKGTILELVTKNFSSGKSFRRPFLEPWTSERLKLIYDRQSVDQSVLVPGTYLGLVTNFSLSLKCSLDSCGFVIW
jgi:hypothetical protein